MSHDSHGTPGKGTSAGPEGFLKAAFGFFSEVLTAIAGSDFLRVAWGVEVLLLLILAFMTLFGGITPDQAFSLALVIIAAMLGTFAISARWAHVNRQPPSSAGASLSAGALPDRKLAEQGLRCLALLEAIGEANERILHRGRAGTGPWVKIQTDTYNAVCRTCHQRRFGASQRDGYYDVICSEPDVGTVCDRKWLLGEALDTYRKCVDRASPPPQDHDDLELLIRRSVTQPDLSPGELQIAVHHAIERAGRVLGRGAGARDR